MHNPVSFDQRRGSHPPSDAVPPSSSSPQVRRRASFRERFWTRTSATHNTGDDASPPTSCQSTTTKRAPYVPVNAASGFSRTMGAARDPARRGLLASMSEEDEESSSTTSPTVAQTAPLPRVPESGHPHPHSDPDAETDDFAEFITAAEAEDRARRAEQRLPIAIAGSHSKQRDSGYYSGGGGRDRDLHLPPPATAMGLAPAPAPAATERRTLRRQPSIRAVGQRIAEYIRPTRTNPTSEADIYRQSG